MSSAHLLQQELKRSNAQIRSRIRESFFSVTEWLTYGTSYQFAQILQVSVNSVLLPLLLPFNGLFSRTTWVSRYQKGKNNLDFTGARDSEWQ